MEANAGTKRLFSLMHMPTLKSARSIKYIKQVEEGKISSVFSFSSPCYSALLVTSITIYNYTVQGYYQQK